MATTSPSAGASAQVAEATRAAVVRFALMRLNLDVAELDDEPEALTPLAELLNVACGAHAGDDALATRAIRRARRYGVAVGAHPSYPDREGFGRRAVELPLPALRASLRSQLVWLRAIAAREGVTLSHVKLHGALYHAANRSEELAGLALDVARDVLGEVSWIAPPEGALRAAGRAKGVTVLRECFADRGYGDDGALIPRGTPGDVLSSLDAVRAQVLRFVREGRYDTVCVHGDGAHALEVARAVREALAWR